MMQETLNSQLGQMIIHLDPADRFIPQRHCLEQTMLNMRCDLEKNACCQSVLQQDISQHYVKDYRRYLEVALNINSHNGRLLRFSRQPLEMEKTNHEEYQWPVRSRKRPLIRQPYALLDLPNFRASFFLNLLDWGPSRQLAAALDRSVYLYAVGEDPEELNKLIHGYWSSVKWNTTGDRLLIGANQSLTQVWNTETRKLEKEMVCHCFEHGGCVVNALEWHPNNAIHASGCSSGTLQVHHHLPGYKSLCLDFAHEGEITALKSSPDGSFLASSGEDGAVRVWLWPNLATKLEVKDYDFPIRAMAWHPWKPSLLVIGGGNDGTLTIWNVNKCSKESHLLDPRASVCGVDFSPITGELVVSLCMDPTTDINPLGRSVILVLKSLQKVVDRMEFMAGQIHQMMWSRDGKELAVVGSDETLRIWYFLGPSSARAKDVSRYLKPLVPSYYVIPPQKQTRKKRTKINNFGCTIR